MSQSPERPGAAAGGNPLLQLPVDMQGAVLRGVRERLVRNELEQLGTPAARNAVHESLHGEFVIRRPHERMVVLVIRPFAESRLDVPHARVARFSFGPALTFALRRIVKERWASGLVFVGLATRRDVCATSVIAAWWPAIVTAGLAGTALLTSSRAVSLVAVAAGLLALVRGLADWRRDRHLRIRNSGELARAIDRVRRRDVAPLTFFRASDDLWQETVLQLAQSATLIVADVGRRADGLQWELTELGRLYPDHFLAWAINPDYNWGAGKLATAPDGVKVETLITAFGQPMIDRIATAVGPLRRRYDARVARELLTPALAGERWADMFWKGIAAVAERRFDAGRPLFAESWSTARAEASALAIYPAIALLDSLMMTDDDDDAANGLLVEIGQWLSVRSPQKAEWLDRVMVESSNKYALHRDEQAELRLRLLLNAIDALPDTPLALWQFRALLGRGIDRVLGRGVARRV